jgi:predicted phage-related endonuclease
MKKYAKEFRMSTAPQRSPQWYKERAGIPSASGLGALFDTLRDGRTPSAKSKAYRKQLAFERKFGVTYDRFKNQAMRDGITYEDFAKLVYERETGNKITEAFSYISGWFVATPDAHVQEVELINGVEILGKKGLLECKIVGDETFMQMMEEGAPLDHDLQTQGQLMASGLDWVDYIVVNLKTKHYFILHITRKNKLIKRIYERLHEPLDLPELRDIGVKQFDDRLLHEYMGGSSVIDSPEPIKDLGF